MPAKVRMPSTVEITRAEADLLRRLARVPLNQLVNQRRAIIRALRRRGLTPREIAQWLKLTRDQVIREDAEAGAGQGQASLPRNR